MTVKNLWFYTEEYPKKEVIVEIFKLFANEYNVSFLASEIRIIPLIDKITKKFSFTYQVLGINTEKLGKIYIKIISGHTSFVDYLIFYQKKEPSVCCEPIYAIEETKTDDSESRNTGVYQRCSKFVYIDSVYPSAKKFMLYSIQVEESLKPTETNIFGSKLLATIGVKILGKRLNEEQEKPFQSIGELIEFKERMRKPPKGNVPIEILKKSKDCITISGRLIKNGTLSHDPNIGALSIISASLRALGWKKQILIINHGLSQKNITPRNKFVRIANIYNIDFLDNESRAENKIYSKPKINKDMEYWKFETKGEKVVSILVHLLIENFTAGFSVFNNHAGCEKSYFYNANANTVTPIRKYRDKEKYKKGDKNQIVQIPDLVLVDIERREILNIEAKTYLNRKDGISELSFFDAIEDIYIKPAYKGFNIIRTLIVYAQDEDKIIEVQISFLLNKEGKIVLGLNPPGLFVDGVNNLFAYWSN